MSGRQPDGQKDHPGVTRELVPDPEQAVVVRLAGGCACGRELAGLDEETLAERFRVIDLVVRR